MTKNVRVTERIFPKTGPVFIFTGVINGTDIKNVIHNAEQTWRGLHENNWKIHYNQTVCSPSDITVHIL